jgi:glycosyltransferase involved in cell wall biosynthesis
VSPLQITALLAAKNEAANLPTCLATLKSFARTVVLDSHSTDNTAAIAAEMGAEVVQFDYSGGYPKKRQWALEHLQISTPWILLLDSDESLTPQLIDEIAAVVQAPDSCDAYLIRKGFHFLGSKFRFGGFSHAAILLFRTGKARFERLVEDHAHALDMEVHERVIVDGSIGSLRSPLIHRDNKGLEAYIDRHNKYSTWEARARTLYLHNGTRTAETVRARLFGNVQERRRFLKMLAIRVPGEPYLWFLYHYIFRLGFLEGRPGLIASQLRCQYISQVRAKMYESKRLESRLSESPRVS